MSTMIRLQFSRDPDPKTLGMILAAAALDPSFEDSDTLRDPA